MWARKAFVDSVGVEPEVPMNDLVEIGIFAPAGEDGELTAPLRLHRQPAVCPILAT